MSWYGMPFESTEVYHQIESDIRSVLLNDPNIVTYLKIFHLKRPSLKNCVLQNIPRQRTVSATQDKLIEV
jgi:hypothetical protein